MVGHPVEEGIAMVKTAPHSCWPLFSTPGSVPRVDVD
jgi:hypothetical protein